MTKNQPERDPQNFSLKLVLVSVAIFIVGGIAWNVVHGPPSSTVDPPSATAKR